MLTLYFRADLEGPLVPQGTAGSTMEKEEEIELQTLSMAGEAQVTPHSGTLGGGPIGDIRRKCDHIQSRLRIRIEMAFGMLKMRFAILRRPFPAGLGLRRFVRTTKALGVLHNCKCHACTCSGATFLRCCCLCSDVAVMLLRCW